MIATVHIPADEPVTDFITSLEIVQERRTQGAARPAAPNFDGARLASAFRAKPRRPASAAPTRHAFSPAPCRHCGARGDIGCDHFLPFNGGEA